MITWDNLRSDLQLEGRHVAGTIPAGSDTLEWRRWAHEHTWPVKFRGRDGWRSLGPLDSVLKRLSAHLQASYTPPACVFGFVPGRSTVAAARQHVGAESALALDLRDFFGQIDEHRVRAALAGLLDPQAIDMVIGACLRRNALPLGFRTSPILSNIVFEPTDRYLEQLCRSSHATYTRWVDDLVFSGPTTDDEFLSGVRQALEEHDWELRESKTRFMSSRRVVLGLNVASDLDRPHVPRGIKTEVRKQIYFLRKFGFAHFSRSSAWPLERLLGMVAYVKSVDPALASVYEEQMRELPHDARLIERVGASGGGRWQVRLLKDLGLSK